MTDGPYFLPGWLERTIRGDVLRALVTSLLLVLGGLASADASAQARARADAAAFDRLVEEVENGDRVITSPQEVRAVVQQLDALRPHDDVQRELRLRAFRCDYDDLGPPASGLAYARAGLDDARRLKDVASQVRFQLCEASYIDSSGLMSQSLAPVEAAPTKDREP